MRRFTERGRLGARIIKEFPVKKWDTSLVNRVILKKKHPKSTESTERKVASGRLKTACTEEKVQHVEEVVCSLKDNTESKRS